MDGKKKSIGARRFEIHHLDHANSSPNGENAKPNKRRKVPCYFFLFVAEVKKDRMYTSTVEKIEANIHSCIHVSTWSDITNLQSFQVSSPYP